MPILELQSQLKDFKESNESMQKQLKVLRLTLTIKYDNI